LLSAAAFGQSSVWKISNNGNIVYLAGSIHLLRQRDYPLPTEFDAAFDNSEILVLEADVSNMEGRVYTQLENGETLESRLSKKTYSLFLKRAGEFSLPLSAFRNLRPSMAVAVFSVRILTDLGFTVPGVDFHYLARAKAEAKDLMYLESVETHLGTLSAVSRAEDEDRRVFEALNELDDAGPELMSLVNGWRAGMPDAAENFVREMQEKRPEIYEIMLAARNLAWIPVIRSCLATPETEFIIAGIAHFYGPDGLLELLARQGFRVEQLNLDL
jgi:uncharacterized protein YbaP (TraB family)